MTTENIENATKEANVGAQGAAVAPEKAPAKKPASPKKGAPQSERRQGCEGQARRGSQVQEADPGQDLQGTESREAESRDRRYPRRQQNRHHHRPAAPGQGRDIGRNYGGGVLAAAQRSGIYQRDPRQENGPGRKVGKARRRHPRLQHRQVASSGPFRPGRSCLFLPPVLPADVAPLVGPARAGRRKGRNACRRWRGSPHGPAPP